MKANLSENPRQHSHHGNMDQVNSVGGIAEQRQGLRYFHSSSGQTYYHGGCA